MPVSSSPLDVIDSYLAHNYRLVFWPHIGDNKGPREAGWPEKIYRREDYVDGYRVGILTGTEVQPNKFLTDIDIDWTPGSLIAQKLLPSTGFVFGRTSKRVSHCFYLLPEPLPSFRYEDIDKTCLLELRGTKTNGDLGFQTMVPPSIWTKDGQREPLTFIRFEEPAFLESAALLKSRATLAAIGMLLARNFGKNGFGHESRLAWAGFLLRAGLSVDDLVMMGEVISGYTNNLEVEDVRVVVEGTAIRLQTHGQKIKGGPALAKLFGDKGKAILGRINEWLGRSADFARGSDGSIIKDHQDNIQRAIQLLDVEFSHNAFSERLLIEQAPQPKHMLSDHEITDLWFRIDREFRFRPSFVFFEKVVTNIAYSRTFHPVRDYLARLAWDGIPRVNFWLHRYGGAPESEFHEAVAGIVLIAAVRRVRDPGCKYDEMLVLESAQGLNKSSALRALCPDEEWFSDDLPLNVDAKQIIERTLGKWIIEASDLVGGRKADRDHLKSMLSRQVDGPARLAYAHMPIERARQFIIVGSTNSAAYLADPTGARRFWPVAVRKFDVEGIKRDRDQLWAEAAVREARGESIRLPERLWAIAEGHQEERREVDAWEEILEGVLENRMADGDGRKRIPLSDLWELVQPDPSRRDRLSGIRLSEIMQRLGYRRSTMRDEEGKVVRSYTSFKAEVGLFEQPEE